jgi:hypothetical protein
MPVRITDAARPLDPDARVRTLLPRGEELVAEGARVVRLRPGREPERVRMPLLERALRRIWLSLRRLRVRGYGDGSAGLPL